MRLIKLDTSTRVMGRVWLTIAALNVHLPAGAPLAHTPVKLFWRMKFTGTWQQQTQQNVNHIHCPVWQDIRLLWMCILYIFTLHAPTVDISHRYITTIVHMCTDGDTEVRSKIHQQQQCQMPIQRKNYSTRNCSKTGGRRVLLKFIILCACFWFVSSNKWEIDIDNQ